MPATVEPAQRNELALRIDLSQRRFQKVLDVPDLSPLYRGLALQGLGRNAEAEQAFRDATRDSTATQARHIEAEMGVAESLAAQQSLPQALELTRHVTTEHADSALAWFVHGALLARSNLAEADKALVRARATAPGQLDVMRQIALVATHADVQLALRDVAGAKDSSAALNRLAGGSPLAVLVGARVSMAGNDYVTAAADLRRLVNSVPNFVQARFLLGVVLMTQGSLEQASTELGQVVKLAPANLEARQLLAQVRMRLEDPDGALRVLVPALQANAGDESLAALVGAASAQRGSGKHAPELLERALKEAPDNQALQLQLASAYLQAGDADKALALLRGTENAGADVRRQALLLGAIVKAEGPASAERQIEKMLAANPNDASLLNLAAAWYVGAQNAERARALLNDALARAPRQTALLFTLAQLEARTQHPEAASAALERLLAVDPGHAPARLALAQLALARGDREAAKTQLETLRGQDKRAIDARLLLARIALERDDATVRRATHRRSSRRKRRCRAHAHRRRPHVSRGGALRPGECAFPRGHDRRSHERGAVAATRPRAARARTGRRGARVAGTRADAAPGLAAGRRRAHFSRAAEWQPHGRRPAHDEAARSASRKIPKRCCSKGKCAPRSASTASPRKRSPPSRRSVRRATSPRSSTRPGSPLRMRWPRKPWSNGCANTPTTSRCTSWSRRPMRAPTCRARRPSITKQSWLAGPTTRLH